MPAWRRGTEEKLRAATNPLRPLALLRLAGAWVRLARRFRQVGPQDVVLVGEFGHLDVHLARLLAGRRRVVLDMFLSVYDTVVLDRGPVAPGSLRARLCRLLDRRAVRASRLAVLDTRAQVGFCDRVLGIPEASLAVVPVGAEPERFPARPPPAQDPQALAATPRALAGDRDLVATLGRRARARFERDHAPAPLGRRRRAVPRQPGGSAAAGWVPPRRFLLRLDLVRRLLARLDRDQPALELGWRAGRAARRRGGPPRPATAGRRWRSSSPQQAVHHAA